MGQVDVDGQRLGVALPEGSAWAEVSWAEVRRAFGLTRHQTDELLRGCPPAGREQRRDLYAFADVLQAAERRYGGPLAGPILAAALGQPDGDGLAIAALALAIAAVQRQRARAADVPAVMAALEADAPLPAGTTAATYAAAAKLLLRDRQRQTAAQAAEAPPAVDAGARQAAVAAVVDRQVVEGSAWWAAMLAAGAPAATVAALAADIRRAACEG